MAGSSRGVAQGRGSQSVRRVSVIGLGKLGLCIAAVLAESGFEVAGVDSDEKRVEVVNRGKSPIYEPGLQAMIRANSRKLRASTDHERAVLGTDATFVVVPTPSDEQGGFSLSYVTQAMRQVGAAMSRKDRYHLVVLTSTVMPGSMDGAVLPALESSSGRECVQDFGLCYNPEFIALGDVVAGLRSPDFVLVGESDKRAGDMLERVHRRVCTNRPRIERMDFVNAEVTKISVNAFVTMKMSFANNLAEICERLPKGDVDRVTKAMGRDRRIGSAYLKGAMGYGGPCFPRDNAAFARLARGVGVSADLALATDRINERQLSRVVELVSSRACPGSRVGVLGLTYKPNTDVTEASQSLALANVLAAKGFEVHVYDPSLRTGRRDHSLRLEESAEACVGNSEVCVIATPWPRFAKVEARRLAGKTVLDCWRLLNGSRPTDPGRYIALGRDMLSGRPSRV